MKILITLGATREPIDAVRFIGNRSSGKMGSAIASAAITLGHEATMIVANVAASLPADARRCDVETAKQMHDAVLRELPSHDLLIMAAAVADYRPVRTEAGKLSRGAGLTIVCEPTEDILADAAAAKRADQRVVGFSLETRGNIARAREKMAAKRVDLMVFNPLQTMGSEQIEATLLWPDGRSEEIGRCAKSVMAQILIERAVQLFA